MTLKQKLIEFLTNNPQTLEQIYKEFSEQKPSTIKGRINENVDRAFKRISRGVYLAIQGDDKALIIKGDAWVKEFIAVLSHKNIEIRNYGIPLYRKFNVPYWYDDCVYLHDLVKTREYDPPNEIMIDDIIYSRKKPN